MNLFRKICFIVVLLTFITACSSSNLKAFPTITPFPESISPFLVATGDSIAEGHGLPNPYHSVYHDGPSGDLNHEIWFQLSKRIDGLTYQNLAKGSQTCEWVRQVGIPDAVELSPKLIIVHCGINDIADDRLWMNVENDLDEIRVLTSDQVLLIDEILPWTASTDEQSRTIREWNRFLADWTAENNAFLIPLHDRMGALRPSTGELDNINQEYSDGSGIHLNEMGVKKMADFISQFLLENKLTPADIK